MFSLITPYQIVLAFCDRPTTFIRVSILPSDLSVSNFQNFETNLRRLLQNIKFCNSTKSQEVCLILFSCIIHITKSSTCVYYPLMCVSLINLIVYYCVAVYLVSVSIFDFVRLVQTYFPIAVCTFCVH